ncbi:MAG: hypothetical protein GY765_35295, partial [bacterium]|nr:hypothetical protein [bacterium]
MSKYVKIWIVLLLVLFMTSAAQAGEKPLKPLSITVTPHNKTSGNPAKAVFTFSLPMVEKRNLKTAPHPTITFRPNTNGTFKWLSPTQLEFIPQDDYLWCGNSISTFCEDAVPLAGKKYEKVWWSTNFYIAYYYAAGKVANWPVTKHQPRFVGFLDWKSEHIGKGALFILYDQPVNPDKIKKLLEVLNSSGKTIKRRIYRPTDISQVTTLNIDTRHLIAVKIKRLPKDGKKITVAVPDWKAGKFDLLEYDFKVNTTFKIRQWYHTGSPKGKPVKTKTSLYLDFNNSFHLPLLKKAIQITPAPKSIEIVGSGWQQARVQLELEPGTDYSVGFGKEFFDILGNRLEKEGKVFFRTRDLPPLLHVPGEPVLLERGTRRLPISVCNIKQLEAWVYKVDSVEEYLRLLKMGRKKSASAYGLGGRQPDRIEKS